MDAQTPHEPTPPETPPLAAMKIAGFWQRLVAFVLDCLILGLFGMALGSLFFEQFARLGPWGRLIGFVVIMLYAGVLNSSIGKGKTVGKRAMRIEVIGRSGGHISLPRSLGRQAIFATPFLLNGIPLSPDLMTLFPTILLSLVVFGVGTTIVYLFLFNRQTRQSLHDLATSTIVVKSQPAGPPPIATIWKLHFVVAAIITLGAIAAPSVVLRFFPADTLTDLLAVQKKLFDTGKIHSASLFIGSSWSYSGGNTNEVSYANASMSLKDRPDDYEGLAGEFAAILLENQPEIMEKDLVLINLSYGFDIGIARTWISRSFSHPPDAWAGMIDSSESTQ